MYTLGIPYCYYDYCYHKFYKCVRRVQAYHTRSVRTQATYAARVQRQTCTSCCTAAMRVRHRSLCVQTRANARNTSTGARSPNLSSRYLLDLPSPEGWKAELTLLVGYILIRQFTRPHTVTRSTSRSNQDHHVSKKPLSHI